MLEKAMLLSKENLNRVCKAWVITSTSTGSPNSSHFDWKFQSHIWWNLNWGPSSLRVGRPHCGHAKMLRKGGCVNSPTGEGQNPPKNCGRTLWMPLVTTGMICWREQTTTTKNKEVFLVSMCWGNKYLVPRFNRCAYHICKYVRVRALRKNRECDTLSSDQSIASQTASMLVTRKAPTLLILVLVATTPFSMVESTSFKMDFLSSGTVRTDPLMFSQEILKKLTKQAFQH